MHPYMHTRVTHPTQVCLSCVLVEALACGCMRVVEVMSAADDGLLAIPSRSLHWALITWQVYCLTQVGGWQYCSLYCRVA